MNLSHSVAVLMRLMFSYIHTFALEHFENFFILAWVTPAGTLYIHVFLLFFVSLCKLISTTEFLYNRFFRHKIWNVQFCDLYMFFAWFSLEMSWLFPCPVLFSVVRCKIAMLLTSSLIVHKVVHTIHTPKYLQKAITSLFLPLPTSSFTFILLLEAI
jgi:hypothetical protein